MDSVVGAPCEHGYAPPFCDKCEITQLRQQLAEAEQCYDSWFALSDLISRLRYGDITADQLLEECEKPLEKAQPEAGEAICPRCNGQKYDPEPNPICCGNLSVGAEYMGQQELVCCGSPEPDFGPCRDCNGEGTTTHPAPVVPESKSISHLIELELMHNPSGDARVICDAAAERIVNLLSAAQEKEPLLKAAGHVQTGCYCKPGRCMAPVVMGRQTKCLDPNKAAQEQGG